MKTFPTFVDQVEEDIEFFPYRKIAIAHAKQMDEDFRVNSMEGDYAQGKAGDYLMMGIDGELYICDEDIFKKTYEEIQ